MKLNIIQIGNSRGIRIPATILSECHIESEVDMQVENDRIILIPIQKKTRENWDLEMKQMSENNNDELLIDDVIDFEQEDLEW